jgi:NAD(P)-dependent dehydrogenase (short-subunit alcohol dehydrogenase family)
MTDTRITLVTGANQGVGLQLTKELVAHGHTVYLGSRDLARGEQAAAGIAAVENASGGSAIPIQIDVTDVDSISAAAARIRAEQGRLDMLVNNAGISKTVDRALGSPEYRAHSLASNASLDEIRAIWNVNVFGALAVYQAMLPLLRDGKDPRIVMVSSGVGSLATNADPNYAYHSIYGPGYAASKTAMNAMALTIMIELENTDIKVNIVSPAFTATALNGFAGTESIEDGSREVVRVALLGPDGPSGTFTQWENTAISW